MSIRHTVEVFDKEVVIRSGIPEGVFVTRTFTDSDWQVIRPAIERSCGEVASHVDDHGIEVIVFEELEA